MIGLHALRHVNKTSTLVVLQSLLQKSFGIKQKKHHIGSCLIAQVSFTIGAVTGLDAQHIADHIFKYVKKSYGIRGYTLDDVLTALQKPIDTDRGKILLSLGFAEYNGVQEIQTAVLAGYPVMIFVHRDACSRIEDEAWGLENGVVQYGSLIRSHNDFWHAFLAIGVDAAGYLIVRDTRHTYAFNGYLKISTKIIKRDFKELKAISVNVLGISA